ncbi:hypothetical protein FACS189473_2570 [Spirochaetia bacterium]|nr:hypothetical protein FACS189473_2570 [Spirochaetia bacterium]
MRINNNQKLVDYDHEPPGNLDDKRITWHTAFCDAIRLELIQYKDVLDFDIEHQLTREPLRIDIVIIKKRKNVAIDKKIASIFEGRNVVEYKGPDDSLSIADFHKVMAYAHLYCTPPENADITDLTVSFVTTREPKEVKAHLKDVYHYTLTEKWPGITIIEGDVMPMQIIERKKLPEAEDIWLANLGRDLSFESMRAIIDKAKEIPKGAPIEAYLYMLAKANSRQIKEVLKMSDTAVIDDIFIELGATARWEAKGEAKGEEKRAVAMARTMKANNEPVSKITLYTGLTEQQVTELQ